MGIDQAVFPQTEDLKNMQGIEALRRHFANALPTSQPCFFCLWKPDALCLLRRSLLASGRQRALERSRGWCVDQRENGRECTIFDNITP